MIDSVILLGGGIDSTLLIKLYQDQGYKVKGVHFNYGQNANESERESSVKICNYFNIEFDLVDFNFKFKRKDFEIVGRNSTLVLAAYSIYGDSIRRIGIGIHQGTKYYDSSFQFLKSINDIIINYSRGCTYIDAPLMRYNKQQIYNLAKLNKIPIEMTYSCEKQNYSPCGKCPSCLDRRNL